MSIRFWRQWHRWIAFPSAIFLFFAAVTGVLVAGTEFFGEDEAIREATRDLVSPVTVASPATAWSEPIARAVTGIDDTTTNRSVSIGVPLRASARNPSRPR